MHHNDDDSTAVAVSDVHHSDGVVVPNATVVVSLPSRSGAIRTRESVESGKAANANGDRKRSTPNPNPNPDGAAKARAIRRGLKGSK